MPEASTSQASFLESGRDYDLPSLLAALQVDLRTGESDSTVRVRAVHGECLVLLDGGRVRARGTGRGVVEIVTPRRTLTREVTVAQRSDEPVADAARPAPPASDARPGGQGDTPPTLRQAMATALGTALHGLSQTFRRAGERSRLLARRSGALAVRSLFVLLGLLAVAGAGSILYFVFVEHPLPVRQFVRALEESSRAPHDAAESVAAAPEPRPPVLAPGTPGHQGRGGAAQASDVEVPVPEKTSQTTAAPAMPSFALYKRAGAQQGMLASHGESSSSDRLSGENRTVRESATVEVGAPLRAERPEGSQAGSAEVEAKAPAVSARREDKRIEPAAEQKDVPLGIAAASGARHGTHSQTKAKAEVTASGRDPFSKAVPVTSGSAYRVMVLGGRICYAEACTDGIGQVDDAWSLRIALAATRKSLSTANGNMDGVRLVPLEQNGQRIRILPGERFLALFVPEGSTIRTLGKNLPYYSDNSGQIKARIVLDDAGL